MAYIGDNPKLQTTRYTPQSADPSNPIQGEIQYADGTVRAQGLWEYDGSNWVRIASTGAGGINYILNPDAEGGTTGWATYADAAGVDPVDGTGGSPTVTWTPNTTAPLRDTADFLFTKDAADRQGEGVAYDFTIDNADAGKALRISFDYKTSTDYAVSDMGVFIYDVSNNQLITVNETDIPPTNGVSSTRTLDFSTVSNSTSYRFILHVRSTSALAYTVNVDRISVGPDIPVPGAIITEWEEFTPSFTGAGTGVFNIFAGTNALVRRSGSMMEFKFGGEWTTAGSGGSTVVLDLPTNYGSVTPRNVVSGGVNTTFGLSGVSNFATSNIAINTSNQNVQFTKDGAAGNIIGSELLINAQFQIDASIPIEEWIAGATQSTSETLFQSARGRIHVSSNQNINTTAETTVTFDTVDFDKVGVTDVSNNQMIVPADGEYGIEANLQLLNLSASEVVTVRLKINGSTTKTSIINFDSAATGRNVNLVDTQSLSKGDLVTITCQSTADAAYVVSGGSDLSYLVMKRVADFTTFSVIGENQFEAQTSDVKTPSSSGDYLLMTNNSVNLAPGTWILNGNLVCTSDPTTAGFVIREARWSLANGTDTTTAPTAITPDAGDPTVRYESAGSTTVTNETVATARLTVSATTTIYLVPRVNATTIANARVQVILYAERIV